MAFMNVASRLWRVSVVSCGDNTAQEVSFRHKCVLRWTVGRRDVRFLTTSIIRWHSNMRKLGIGKYALSAR